MSQPTYINFESKRDVDIRTVNSETLIDIGDVKIDMDKPLDERIQDYIRQIDNPYCFRCGKITVKVSYADTETTMEECMEGYFGSCFSDSL